MIEFACFSPHPPIILPSVGSDQDRNKVKETIQSLKRLGEEFKRIDPDHIIISSPHPDWGFNVPLHFIAPDFEGKIDHHLLGTDSPQSYFEQGKEVFNSARQKLEKQKVALIGSGDLSHRLKEEGPYGFHPDGPKFDQELINSLKQKDINNMLKLDEKYPQAGECGLRSFCFILGILEAFRSTSPEKIDWNPKILSYQGPFGVGYLVANLELIKES